MTDLQRRTLSALQMRVQAKDATEDSIDKMVLGFLISLITDLPAAQGGECQITKDVERLKLDVFKEPEVVKLKETVAETKKFTPGVCKKLLKPFVARMDPETTKLLVERSQTSRLYGSRHLFDGIVTAIAQKKSQQVSPDLWLMTPAERAERDRKLLGGEGGDGEGGGGEDAPLELPPGGVPWASLP